MSPNDPRLERIPFDPPFTEKDLPQLDYLHKVGGLSEEWLSSPRRAEILNDAKESNVPE